MCETSTSRPPTTHDEHDPTITCTSGAADLRAWEKGFPPRQPKRKCCQGCLASLNKRDIFQRCCHEAHCALKYNSSWHELEPGTKNKYMHLKKYQKHRRRNMIRLSSGWCVSRFSYEVPLIMNERISVEIVSSPLASIHSELFIDCNGESFSNCIICSQQITGLGCLSGCVSQREKAGEFSFSLHILTILY